MFLNFNYIFKKLLNKKPNNIIDVGKNIYFIRKKIIGSNNKILIDSNQYKKRMKIRVCVNGNNNTIIIKNPLMIRRLNIIIGNSKAINNAVIMINENVSIESLEILVYQNNSKLNVGKDCMISNNVKIRTGEVPHLIFNKKSGEYLDTNSQIDIGENVWIGENVHIMKRASVANGSIVGACSMVTKKFEENNCLIAGNPARIAKKDIYWVRDENQLERNSIYSNSFIKYKEAR